MARQRRGRVPLRNYRSRGPRPRSRRRAGFHRALHHRGRESEERVRHRAARVGSLPRRSALSVGFGLEKKISDRFSLTLDSEWDTTDPKGPGEPHEDGFNNLHISPKYAFFIDPEHEAIASIALEATAPTGSRSVDAESAWPFKPFLLYGKGLGDLPQARKYLRPFAVQGDAGVEVSIDHDRSTTFA